MDPNQVAALEPPEGVESNFHNPYTQQPTLNAVSAVTLFLTLSGIGVHVLLLCGVFFIAFISVQTIAGQYGQGRHLWNVTAASPTMFCAKYVVLRQIESVFFNNGRRDLAFTAIRILIWVNLFAYSAISISFILACIPRAKISNPTLPETCINTHASIIATGVINIVSDFAILVTPIVIISQLQMPLKKKLMASGIFAVGVFANITSIVRFYYSIELTRTNDVTWAIIPVASWALGESATVILVACFPYYPSALSQLIHGNQKLGFLV
ncbi:hypothetical protein HD806DRAFT_549105 [Xylariaceae sp. AK1471]|nr:hypothetical protein HD806DRAFT_549105 [Xylariaceae sp. AK1471]